MENKNTKKDHDKEKSKVNKVGKRKHNKETDTNEANNEEVIKIKGKKKC